MIMVISCVLIILIVGVRCSGRKGSTTDETPTRGNIRILADASFQPIVDAEIATFTGLYKYAPYYPNLCA